MACATLKRSLDLDPLQSPRPAKRRRYALVTTSPAIPPTRDGSVSPFAAGINRLSTEAITANIREEMRRLNRRKQLHFGDGGSSSSGPASPSNSNHDLLGESAGALVLQRSQAESKDKPLFTFRQVSTFRKILIPSCLLLNPRFSHGLTKKLNSNLV
jgi:hypothetical protein